VPAQRRAVRPEIPPRAPPDRIPSHA
jgi:hypothetical protein